MPEAANAVRLFVSYARADAALWEELDVHLAPLRRQTGVEIWSDEGVEPGEEWDAAIHDALAGADVVLLLISPRFLASEYIYEVELKEALAKHARGEAVVIPVILKPCDWRREAFARLQALPRGARPVVKWTDRDEAFYEVAEGVRRAVERVRKGYGAA